MPTAVTAIFGGDSRPMEAEYAKMESVAKRFGKTLSDLNAEENAQMLRNSAALKQLIAERKSASSELSRYANSPSQAGGGFLNPRGSMAADQSDWQRRRDEFKAMKGLLGGTAIEAGKSAEQIAKMAQNAGGLNLIIRETLVVFREIGRGNWTRIPGSLSLIAQGFSTLKGISMATLGAWGLAIGGIIGSFFIFYHRVKSLAEALRTSLESAFNPDHIAKYLQKANIIAQLEKDVADSARKIREEHDGVEESLQRQLDMTKDKIAFEREMLELQKSNELATAKTPQERELIEKKYSALITAKKKEERDAEVKAMQDEVRKLPGEIAGTKAEIKRLTEGDFVSAARDAQILKERKDASASYDDYRRQLKPGEKDARAYSADKDRKIISDLAKKQEYYAANKNMIEASGAGMLYRVTDDDVAKAAAARQRLAESHSSQQSANDWMDTADDRERARKRVEELEAKVKADQDRLTKLGPHGGGIIEDAVKRNLERDKQDLAMEKERLKRTDSPGGSERGYGLNAQQRLGTYAATPSDFRRLTDAALRTANNTDHLKPTSNRPIDTRGTGFGGHKK